MKLIDINGYQWGNYIYICTKNILIYNIAGRNDSSHQPCSLAHGCRLSHSILCHTISVNCSRLIRC